MDKIRIVIDVYLTKDGSANGSKPPSASVVPVYRILSYIQYSNSLPYLPNLHY